MSVNGALHRSRNFFITWSVPQRAVPPRGYFHAAKLQALKKIVAAAGLDHPKEFMPAHFSPRVSASEVMTYAELYPTLRSGGLLDGEQHTRDAKLRGPRAGRAGLRRAMCPCLELDAPSQVTPLPRL
jgi:hypothetical protein